MDNEDLKRKDWQVINVRSSITQITHLRLILENQAFIISHLTQRSLTEINEEISKSYLELYKTVEQNIYNNIPFYDHNKEP